MEGKTKLNISIVSIVVGTCATAGVLQYVSTIYPNFQSLSWITLVISVAFGLTITLIVNHRSSKVVEFLVNAEIEKRNIALRTIKDNLSEIDELSQMYLDVITNDKSRIQQNRKALNPFLPKFNVFLSICRGTIPTLSNLIQREEREKIEGHISLLTKLFMLLESGTDQQFMDNIENLKDYSTKAVKFLAEISD